MEERELVIIGGGPAGMSAAVYGRRAGLDVLVLEKGNCGGQILITSEIENYLGQSHSSGPDLANSFRAHAEHFGAEIRKTVVKEIVNQDGVNTVLTKDGDIRAKAVIVATGAAFRRLGAKGEKEFTGAGVSYCAVCDAAFYQDEIVAVIGGGNTAVEEALYLSNIARKVYLVHRRDTLRAEKIMQDKLFAKIEAGKIEPVWHHAVDEVLGDEAGVTGLRVKSVLDGSTRDIDVHGFFVAIGHTPNTSLFEGQLDMSNGYLKIRSGIEGNATATTIPGVFAAGDVTDQHYRQAITSAGFGCMAALDAERFLDKG